MNFWLLAASLWPLPGMFLLPYASTIIMTIALVFVLRLWLSAALRSLSGALLLCLWLAPSLWLLLGCLCCSYGLHHHYGHNWGAWVVVLMACSIIMTIIWSGFVVCMTCSILLTIIWVFVLCLWLEV